MAQTYWMCLTVSRSEQRRPSCIRHIGVGIPIFTNKLCSGCRAKLGAVLRYRCCCRRLSHMHVGCNRASEPRWSITSSALVLLGLKLPGTSWRRIHNKSVRLFDAVLELQVIMLKHRDWITAWLYFFDFFDWLLTSWTCIQKLAVSSSIRSHSSLFCLVIKLKLKQFHTSYSAIPRKFHRLQVRRRMAWIEARKWTLQSYDRKMAGRWRFRNTKKWCAKDVVESAHQKNAGAKSIYQECD